MPSGIYERKNNIPARDRLLAMCIPVTECGCWFFEGGVNRHGYGQFTVSTNRCRLAHRVSFEIFCAPIPKGMFVLHSCDIPCCINPDHLFLGTHDDNMADMSRKGRSGTLGSKNPFSKLTDSSVTEILASKERGVILAAQYGVSQASVSMIRKGHSWKHIKSPEELGMATSQA